MADWVAFFIALAQSTFEWLGSVQILGVSLASILVAFFILGVLVRSLLYKP